MAKEKPLIGFMIKAEEEELRELGFSTQSRVDSIDEVQYFGWLRATDPDTGEIMVLTYERDGNRVKRNPPRVYGGGIRGYLNRLLDRVPCLDWARQLKERTK